MEWPQASAGAGCGRARTASGARAAPVRGVTVGVLQEIEPQAHPQGQVASAGKNGKDAVGRGREGVQHTDQAARLDVALDFPGAAPRQPQALQAPAVQHLAVAAIEPAARAKVGHGADHVCGQ